MAWKGWDDGRPELNVPGSPSSSRKGCQAIQTGSSRGHPHGGDTCLLAPFNLLQDFFSLASTYHDANQLVAHL
jgi:hypothetical protein